MAAVNIGGYFVQFVCTTLYPPGADYRISRLDKHWNVQVEHGEITRLMYGGDTPVPQELREVWEGYQRYKRAEYEQVRAEMITRDPTLAEFYRPYDEIRGASMP